LISHLVAKAIYIPEKQSELLAAARQFFTAYSDAAGSAGATPADTATEVGVLLLCRVDGKSKLEYLDSGGRDAVRRLARELIAGQVTDLDEALALAAAAQPDPSHR
jgi:hypothetical protein